MMRRVYRVVIKIRTLDGGRGKRRDRREVEDC
jgi:hypothetical protein